MIRGRLERAEHHLNVSFSRRNSVTLQSDLIVFVRRDGADVEATSGPGPRTYVPALSRYAQNLWKHYTRAIPVKSIATVRSRPCFSQGQAEFQERPILVVGQRNELVDQSAH